MTAALVLAIPAQPVAGLLLPVDGPVRFAAIAADIAPGSWRWPVRWVDEVDGHQVVWSGERRHVRNLPANIAAWVLAARLGCPDLADRIGLNGDLLVAGIDPRGRAGDVPEVVLRAAYRAGLLDPLVTGPVHTGRGAGAESVGRA